MKTRGLALLSVLAVLAGIDLFARFDARVLAAVQDAPPEWSSTIVTGPTDWNALPPAQPFSNEPWTLIAGANGMVSVLDANLAPSAPFHPHGPNATGPLNLGHGVFTSSSGATQNIIYVSPGDASDRPVTAFVPGPPHISLGDLGPSGRSQYGDVVVSGNFTADFTHELVAAPAGPGVPSVLTLVGLSGNDTITLSPFGTAYTGGLSLAVGNFNGQGYDKIAVGKATGNEGLVNIYEVRGNRFVLLVTGLPLGAGHQNGVFLTAFDLNHDGNDDLIVSPSAGRPRAVAVTFKMQEDTAPLPTPRVIFEYDFFADTRRNGVRLAAGVVERAVFFAATTDDVVSLHRLDPANQQVIQTATATPFGLNPSQRIGVLSFPR